jgi:hypothetical protein
MAEPQGSERGTAREPDRQAVVFVDARSKSLEPIRPKLGKPHCVLDIPMARVYAHSKCSPKRCKFLAIFFESSRLRA